MSEQLVLVWNKNRRTARIHRDERGPTLDNHRVTRIPARSEAFAGSGTAGWLPIREAIRLPGAKPCERCM
jgi:hypothetical protein